MAANYKILLNQLQRQKNAKTFRRCSDVLFCYWFGVLAYRCASKGLLLGAVDMLWACNVSLLLAAVAVRRQSNLLIDVCINLVSLAHVTWMIDVVAYCFTGSMPLGRASYMLWPDATLAHNLTTLHHGWFIPLMLYLLARNGGVLQWRSSGYAFVLSLCIGAASLAVPKTLDGAYLNINLAHEMWPDITVDALHAFDPPLAHPLVYFFIMIAIVNALNVLFYAAVRAVASRCVY